MLVLNTKSGAYQRDSARMRAAIQREKIRLVDTIDVGDAARVAKWMDRPDGERPLIVAAGGDGTIGAVANCIAGRGVVMGILPIGTNNDTARSLGIPEDIEGAVHVLVAGTATPIDAGRFVPCAGEHRLFVQAAALGIQVTFARLATSVSFRRKLGRLTYVAASIAALREQEPLDVGLRWPQGEEHLQLLYLAVLNAPVFGGALGLHLEEGSMRNRTFQVLVIEKIPRYRVVLALLPLLFGKRPRGRGIHVFQASRLTISSDRALDVTLDGEIAGQVPGSFEIAPDVLSVMKP